MVEALASSLDGAMCATHEGEPAVLACSRCGSFACRACAIDMERHLCRACGAQPVDWERWRELGLVAGYVATTRALFFEPTRFFRQAAQASSGPGPAIGFGVIAFTLAQLAYFVQVVSLILFTGVATEAPESELGAVGAMLACVVPFVLVQAPLQGAIASTWSAAWSHLTLHLLGGRGATFEQTLRAVSYANAPYVLWLVPCLGWILPFFWVPALEVIALRETHRVGTEIALVAALGHRVVLVLLVVGLYAALFGLALAGLGNAR